MAAPTHHSTEPEEPEEQIIAPEYQQFIDQRIALYKRIMVLRKLKEKYAIDSFAAAMDVLNEQFTTTLIYSVRYDRQSYILAR